MAQLGDEDHSLAQYWYSPTTIRVLTQLCEGHQCIALLSTPSIYYALTEEMRSKAVLFEYDRKWEAGNTGFRFFDYEAPPSDLGTEFAARCDLVIADPPRIMESVVAKYMEVIGVLLCPGGHIVFTSAMENEYFFAEEHSLFARNFVPQASAAWAAVGRFRLYTNFTQDCLKVRNLEDFPGGEDEDDYSTEQCGWAY
mmetsp:Transcript_45264/g.101872  ORF Transcript_45264/g.101872 Transcript_45264/m.101872 type:complete len:197 (-) Transcript_45264:210-800(-)